MLSPRLVCLLRDSTDNIPSICSVAYLRLGGGERTTVLWCIEDLTVIHWQAIPTFQKDKRAAAKDVPM